MAHRPFMSLQRRACFFAILALPGVAGCKAKSASDGHIRTSGENLVAIAEAFDQYGARNRSDLPPRVLKTADGKPVLSWRVAILPMLGQETLYNEFNLNEPWDSEHNRPLVSKMPAVYKSMRGDAPAGKTNYLAIAAPGSSLQEEPIRTAYIVDGTSNTIMVVEVDDEHAVEWTRPDDFAPGASAPATGLGWPDDNRFLMLMTDGSVQLFPNTCDAAALAGLFTADGGEPLAAVEEFFAKGIYQEGTRGPQRRNHFDLLKK